MGLILITGGAGFIGQNLAMRLLAEGRKIRILDNFSGQVHSSKFLPKELEDRVDLVRADIRDRISLQGALEGVETIVHLAAETGTGQSMYEIEKYFSVNVQGTALLIDVLQNECSLTKLKSIIVASSRAIYGEGAYRCKTHGMVHPGHRTKNLMTLASFDLLCPHCSGELRLEQTSEDSPFKPMSMYGLTKQVQEQAILLFAETRGINAFALRYQNVYGPGQSLKNPYTGLLAVFSNLARQNKAIEVYEDGVESRDFVYISDVVEATCKCINFKGVFCGAINIGAGVAISVMDVAVKIKKYFNARSEIKLTGAFRLGDIRHNVADIAAASKLLAYSPKVNFDEGLSKFLDWAQSQPIEDGDAYAKSVEELGSKGLMGHANLGDK